MSEPTFHIEVGDSQSLTVSQIWPDGDAPENPTVEDVIALLRKEGPWRVQHDWDFGFHAAVDGKAVRW